MEKEDSLDKFVKKSLKAINPSVTDETIEEVQTQTRRVIIDPSELAKALDIVVKGDTIKTTDDYLDQAIHNAGKKLREGEEEE